MTYLHEVNISRSDKIVRRKISLIEQAYTLGKLLYSAKCLILLDTAANNSFLPKHII